MSADVPQPADREGRILLFGGGRMGSAMLRGWLEAGIAPERLAVVDPQPPAELEALAARHGIALTPQAGAAPAAAVVLAVKPQKAAELKVALPAVARPGTLLISIMAGKTIADLRALAPGVEAVVRAMPNLPAAVGRGATVAFADRCSAAQRDLAADLLGATGAFEWLDDESLIDAATGLSGSGPAYVFYLVECLAEAGARAGLPPEMAARLARATVAGAGALLEGSDKSAAELRRDVTSPAGTTEAGLRVLMRGDDLLDLLSETVAAAARRAAELAG